MPVETYECSETASEPIEIAEEAIDLIEQLGLDGQRELVTPRDGDDRGSRLPYREMTRDERFVYSVLCPNSVKLAAYKQAPIPVRVLQVAAHAKDHFGELVVWDKENAEEKDPVLVGIKGNYPYGNYRIFILARWGDELESFPVLLTRAVEKGRERFKSECAKAMAKLKSRMDSVDESSMDDLCDSSGALHKVSLYGVD